MKFIRLQYIKCCVADACFGFGCSGSEFSEDTFIAKVKMEIVVCKEQVIPFFATLTVLLL